MKRFEAAAKQPIHGVDPTPLRCRSRRRSRIPDDWARKDG
jgi:hypothetical protein